MNVVRKIISQEIALVELERQFFLSGRCWLWNSNFPRLNVNDIRISSQTQNLSVYLDGSLEHCDVFDSDHSSHKINVIRCSLNSRHAQLISDVDTITFRTKYTQLSIVALHKALIAFGYPVSA